MTSRELVFRSLEFKVPDRAPRNLWRLPWVDTFVADQLEAVLREFPDDFTIPDQILPPGQRRQGVEKRKGTYVDDWGCPWEVGEDGMMGEVKHPPLANWSALKSFSPPWEIIEGADWDAVNRAQENNLANKQKFMLCSTTIRPFERMQFLRGSENIYLDLGYDTSELRALRDMVHDFNLKELAGWVKTDCDALTVVDDWGSQASLLIAPVMWRELFKPLYRDYCNLIHAAGKKVFFHSDGYIFDIYEDLIEIGVDAVNSQLFCMDIEEIGRRFKGQITFWGEIDRQHILPFGTPQDVWKAVGRVRRALDDGAGGLIAQCEWGANNPAENICAVFEAWQIVLTELGT